jgi:AcrR family transcriptional regulator
VAFSPVSFQRARSPEHKQVRVASILQAARALAAEQGVRAVTLTEVAAAADLNKSAVLRYFGTREEIFLHLAAEGWRGWAEAVRTELSALGAGSPTDLADVLTRTLHERPLFCDLLVHAPLNLERNAGRDAVLAFKIEALGALENAAACVEAFLPELTIDAARQLVGATSVFAAAMWQSAHPSEPLATLYTEKPELAHAVVDFQPRLHALVRALAVGLVRTTP